MFCKKQRPRLSDCEDHVQRDIVLAATKTVKVEAVANKQGQLTYVHDGKRGAKAACVNFATVKLNKDVRDVLKVISDDDMVEVLKTDKADCIVVENNGRNIIKIVSKHEEISDMAIVIDLSKVRKGLAQVQGNEPVIGATCGWTIIAVIILVTSALLS